MAQYKPFMTNFLLGGLSGCVAKTAVAPMERIKLILQTQQGQTHGKMIQSRYNGITDCLMKVVRTEGVQKLWKGNGVNVLKVFPMNAFSLALKDLFGKVIKVKNPGQNKLKFLMASMLSGGLAGGCTITIVFPLDFVRTKLATDMLSGAGKRKYTGIYDCFKQTIKTDGIAGCYKGISMALTGVFLYKALTLGVYDYLKQTVITDQTSFWKKYLIANAVTQTTNLILYPFDTVGRTLMMQSGRGIKKYKNPIGCFKKILRKEGVTGLYKGCLTDSLTGLGTSLILVMYDDLKKIFINRQFH